MEKGISRRGKGSSDSGKGSSHRGRNESGKKTSKQVVKKRHPTLFALPGFDVSVNKIDKKTKKVITSFVRKDVVVGSEGVALPKFLSSYPFGGCHKEFNTPQGLGGHQIWPPSATSSTLTITSTHEESKKEDNRKDNRGSVMRRSYSLLTGKAILNNFGNTKFIMHD